MDCPYCGASVPDQDTFCRECGRRVRPEPASGTLASAAGVPAPAKRKINWLLVAVLVVLVGGGGVCLLLGGGGALYLMMRPTETPLPTATYTLTTAPAATWTPLPTATGTPTATPVPTAMPAATATPVPTATLRPTRAATATSEAASTPTPVGQIYADDMSSDRRVWYTGGDEDFTAEIADGRLVVQVTTSELIIRDVIGQDVTDVVISVVAYPQSNGDDYEYGLVFREQDNDNFYIAGVSVSGLYEFYKLVDDQWVELVPWTESNAINSDRNELRVVCVGDQIAFYANGTLLFQYTDDTFSRGDIGVFVGTWEEPEAEVEFDDFVAREPEKGDLPAGPAPTPQSAGPTPTPQSAGPTATPQRTWADYLYADLVRTRNEYLTIKGWYDTLYAGNSVQCPSQSYALHRPDYVIPTNLTALRSIYDRYLAAAAMVDGTGDVIGPLDRIQLLCREGKDIGQADMDFDMSKLREAGPILDGLIQEASKLR